MPTLKQRVNLTVQPHRYDLLKRISRLQGTSMAAVISETMELVYPVLERVCVVLEAAEHAQETSKTGLKKAVDKAEAELLPHLYASISQFDMFMDDVTNSMNVQPEGVSASVEAIHKAMTEGGPTGGGSRERAGAGGVNPRICNTGVRSKRKQPKGGSAHEI
jgi:hypothetical protein